MTKSLTTLKADDTFFHFGKRCPYSGKLLLVVSQHVYERGSKLYGNNFGWDESRVVVVVEKHNFDV